MPETRCLRLDALSLDADALMPETRCLRLDADA
jgi:hypothetical protein